MSRDDPHGAPSSGTSHFIDAFNIMIRFATLLGYGLIVQGRWRPSASLQKHVVFHVFVFEAMAALPHGSQIQFRWQV